MTLQEQISNELHNYIKQSAKHWLPKEIVKSMVATQFIGHGASNSSTDRYSQLYSKYKLANTGVYTKEDVVWISCNGRRVNRIPVVVEGELNSVYTLLEYVIEAGALIIADTLDHLRRTKRYNIGEIELEDYLLNNNYKRAGSSGIWLPV